MLFLYFGTESNSTEPLFISVHIREDPGTEPDHTVGLKLFALELRLDYMGTGVLMCRVSSLAVSLRDEWKINRSKKSSESFIPTRRLVQFYVRVSNSLCSYGVCESNMLACLDSFVLFV
jgi:hypothetical protein